MGKYIRDRDGFLRSIKNGKVGERVPDKDRMKNPFMFSGTEDKFDDDYEDSNDFIQVD